MKGIQGIGYHPGQREDEYLAGMDHTEVVELLDHFTDATYGKDSALTLESDPTGKFSVVADRADWLVTLVDGDGDAAEVINVADDGPGGWLSMTTNNKANDTINAQMNGESFKLADGMKLWFETIIEVEDVDKDDVVVGLATAGATDIIDSAPNDWVGFKIDHDGNIDYHCSQNGTDTTADTTKDIDDATATVGASEVKLAFGWDGDDSVRFYVDDALVATVTDNGGTVLIPDDEALSPIMAIQCTDTGADFLRCDLLRVVNQVR